MYAELHLSDPKMVFSYRFDVQERVLRGGMGGVAFGALLGLRDNFRRDVLAYGLHAMSLQCAYPNTKIFMSLPRFRLARGIRKESTVTKSQLLQVFISYHIFIHYPAKRYLSRMPEFPRRHNGMSATKISARVSVDIDKHSGEAHRNGQFEISGPRYLVEIPTPYAGMGSNL